MLYNQCLCNQCFHVVFHQEIFHRACVIVLPRNFVVVTYFFTQMFHYSSMVCIQNSGSKGWLMQMTGHCSHESMLYRFKWLFYIESFNRGWIVIGQWMLMSAKSHDVVFYSSILLYHKPYDQYRAVARFTMLSAMVKGKAREATDHLFTWDRNNIIFPCDIISLFGLVFHAGVSELIDK